MLLQIEPGVYNEAALQSLDFILAEASNWGLTVMLTLSDNWKYHNGIDQV